VTHGPIVQAFRRCTAGSACRRRRRSVAAGSRASSSRPWPLALGSPRRLSVSLPLAPTPTGSQSMRGTLTWMLISHGERLRAVVQRRAGARPEPSRRDTLAVAGDHYRRTGALLHCGAVAAAGSTERSRTRRRGTGEVFCCWRHLVPMTRCRQNGSGTSHRDCPTTRPLT
jgi:hypothetical protein